MTGYDATAAFDVRVTCLPTLGLGISTEFEAGKSGLDIAAFQRQHPDWVQFLELGSDLERGFDREAQAWIGAGLPTTYHFLDVNLEQAEELDEAWVEGTTALAREARAAWICGDAGLWYVGPKDRGHGVLQPPILMEESAQRMGRHVARLRECSGFEVLPENPPAHVYLGPMHLLDYYARVLEESDAGMLLDVAHLAVYQHVTGREPLTALDGFPLERVVEVHVAGGRPFASGRGDGSTFIEDDHGVEILPATWQILEAVLPRARNLKALVFEGERNRADQVAPIFERLAGLLGGIA